MTPVRRRSLRTRSIKGRPIRLREWNCIVTFTSSRTGDTSTENCSLSTEWRVLCRSQLPSSSSWRTPLLTSSSSFRFGIILSSQSRQLKSSKSLKWKNENKSLYLKWRPRKYPIEDSTLKNWGLKRSILCSCTSAVPNRHSKPACRVNFPVERDTRKCENLC